LLRLLFLFDYYAGPLPQLPEDKPLVVFASHVHADHFAPVIFELFGRRADTQYVLSEDIGRKKVPGELLDRVHFVKEGEKFSLFCANGAGEVQYDIQKEPRNGGEGAGEKVRREGAIEIETFHSTDAGVAFWISCEGKEIYYAGDLNNWWWEGEDEEWNQNMAADYQREMEKMAGRTADIAFVPLDPRLETVVLPGDGGPL